MTRLFTAQHAIFQKYLFHPKCETACFFALLVVAVGDVFGDSKK